MHHVDSTADFLSFQWRVESQRWYSIKYGNLFMVFIWGYVDHSYNSQIEWKFLLEEMDAANDLNKANNQEL